MNLKSILLHSLLFFYLALGILLSINTGISHDEFHEQLNWTYNLEAFKSVFGLGSYEKLISYADKYHGVGFQIISQPIQFFLYKFVSFFTGATLESSFLLSKHIVTFVLFFCSGFYFYRLNKLISLSKSFSVVSSSLYLTFPYLYGHSLINPKDIPFLFFWLVATYYFFKILNKIFLEKKIYLIDIIKLSIFTAFLISTRIVGILIFFEFLIGLVILFNFKNIIFFKFLKDYYKDILVFFFIFIFFFYLLNPIFWKNPFEIINSVKHMSKFYNDICTLTLGKCESSLNLPANYYFIWFFFKLPFLSLIGIIVYPLIETIFLKGNFSTIILLSLLFSTVGIILLFIFVEVAIYSEIRHVLFLMPLILIISFYNLYLFNKNFFYLLSCVTIIFFILNNIKLYPYQYSWMNYAAQFYDIDKNFEVDYWGISNKKLQLNILKAYKENKISSDICIYGDGYTNAFLEKKNFRCFGNYIQIDKVKKKPFIAYQNLKNLKRNNPYNCDLIHEESFSYFFSAQKIVIGKVWYCY